MLQRNMAIRMLTSYIFHPENAQPSETMGWLLAIDTSADRAGVALMSGEQLHESTWPASRAQTTQVLPQVQHLLASVHATTEDLAGVVVAIGPGTFTGLRVGLSLGKGLAMAHGLPIAGVSTLAATALPWLEAGIPVAAVLPAGRGRVVWQRFRPGALASDEREAPVNGTPDELIDAVAGAGVEAIVGELPGTLRKALGGAPMPVLASAGLTSRVGALALLGNHRLAQGDVDDLAELEPIYVHGISKATRPVRDGHR
jgi:tRNA threonylcarbamoyladenosine biosynthesis protein TsaB